MRPLIILTCFFVSSFVHAASFNEVWEIVSSGRNDNKIYVGQLPQRKIGLKEMAESPVDIFKAAKKAMTDESDYFPENTLKLIRPNGICLGGKWEITKDTGYSGHFAKGSEGLVIARASVNYSGTKRGEYRSFGIAAKLFPTMDPNSDVKTANFFVIDDNGGTLENHFIRAPLLSEAKLSKFNIIKATIRSFSLELIRKLKLAEKAQNEADQESKIRQLYPISRVGLKEGAVAITPALIKLQGSEDMTPVNESDFREELRVGHYNNNLRFNIYLASVRDENPKWSDPIGHIEFDRDVVSDACDMRLRFHHPWWQK